MIIAACVALAASAYNVASGLIYREIETTSAGIGVMHIPPSWMSHLVRVGFAADKIGSDDCENVLAGAWVIAASQLVAGRSETVGPSRVNPGPIEPTGVPAACVTAAADFYRLPRLLLSAILKTENGRIGQIVWNKNGSYDMGPAQVNSSWLPKLAKAGISRDQVLNDGCLNVAVGAWILAQAMDGASAADAGVFWRHVGDYNSHTPVSNQKYGARVWTNVENMGGGGSKP